MQSHSRGPQGGRRMTGSADTVLGVAWPYVIEEGRGVWGEGGARLDSIGGWRIPKNVVF